MCVVIIPPYNKSSKFEHYGRREGGREGWGVLILRQGGVCMKGRLFCSVNRQSTQEKVKRKLIRRVLSDYFSPHAQMHN